MVHECTAESPTRFLKMCKLLTQLTEMKAMLGMVGETRIVMGCITQTEEGRYSIEDLSASLPLDLAGAAVGHGFITGVHPVLWPVEPSKSVPCGCASQSHPVMVMRL